MQREDRPPPGGKPWRVQRVGSVYEEFKTQVSADAAARDLGGLGIELKVWHWDGSGWRLHEHINP